MMISLAWVAPVVAAQRLWELWLCRRNRLRLLARGGREVRHDTYKTMVGLHVLFLRLSPSSRSRGESRRTSGRGHAWPPWPW